MVLSQPSLPLVWPSPNLALEDCGTGTSAPAKPRRVVVGATFAGVERRLAAAIILGAVAVRRKANMMDTDVTKAKTDNVNASHRSN